MSHNVLLVGSGGREHAIAWKLAQSSRIGKLYVAPGNGGTREFAENVPITAMDIDHLMRFAETKKIDLTVVGPDDPLAAGIVDAFQMLGLPIFGPTRAAAKIEASKASAKKLMQDAGIPTAPFQIFREHREALAHVRARGAPVVVKADGLALGKGAYVCRTLVEAEQALTAIMVHRVHQDAGNEVVVEEYLEGQEISLHALSDGTTSFLFPAAQDHKPVRDGGRGKNTGGMGTIAPVPWVTPAMMQDANRLIVRPALDALAEQERRFTGCLYPGLMMTAEGPRVLEFNARFGDPETQVYMRLLKSDLLNILEACTRGTLAECAVQWHPGFAACIVLASGGYPDAYKKGMPIQGVSEAERVPGVIVFHAGTSSMEDGLITSGGRVLGVSAVGATLREALTHAYEAVGRITFKGMHYRLDIGVKALAMGF